MDAFRGGRPTTDNVAVPYDLIPWAQTAEADAIVETIRAKSCADSITFRMVRPGKANFDVTAMTLDVLRAARSLLELQLSFQVDYQQRKLQTAKMEEDLRQTNEEFEKGLRIEFAVPEQLIGLVIGKGGANVNKVKEATGVDRIVVDNVTSSVRIRGSDPDSVQRAREMLEFQELGIPIHASNVRAITGEKGRNISDIWRKSGCVKVTLEQLGDGEGRVLRIVGVRKSVDLARDMVEMQVEFESKRRSLEKDEQHIKNRLQKIDSEFREFGPGAPSTHPRRSFAGAPYSAPAPRAPAAEVPRPAAEPRGSVGKGDSAQGPASSHGVAGEGRRRRGGASNGNKLQTPPEAQQAAQTVDEPTSKEPPQDQQAQSSVPARSKRSGRAQSGRSKPRPQPSDDKQTAQSEETTQRGAAEQGQPGPKPDESAQQKPAGKGRSRSKAGNKAGAAQGVADANPKGEKQESQRPGGPGPSQSAAGGREASEAADAAPKQRPKSRGKKTGAAGKAPAAAPAQPNKPSATGTEQQGAPGGAGVKDPDNKEGRAQQDESSGKKKAPQQQAKQQQHKQQESSSTAKAGPQQQQQQQQQQNKQQQAASKPRQARGEATGPKEAAAKSKSGARPLPDGGESNPVQVENVKPNGQRNKSRGKKGSGATKAGSEAQAVPATDKGAQASSAATSS